MEHDNFYFLFILNKNRGHIFSLLVAVADALGTFPCVPSADPHRSPAASVDSYTAHACSLPEVSLWLQK